MSNQAQETIIRFSASQLADAQAFEAARAAAYSDADGRQAALDSLAASTHISGSEQSLQEELLSHSNDPAKSSARRAAQLLHETEKTAAGEEDQPYEVAFKPGKGILRISKVTIVPVDEERTARAERMIQYIPSGPKRNRTSFRLRPEKPLVKQAGSNRR